MTLVTVASSDASAIAQTPAATPANTTHWYIVPTAANDCHLNLRSGPSTRYRVLLRLDSCAGGPWCWFQTYLCGRTSPDEVVGAHYSCLDTRQRTVWSDRWTVVALTSSRWAYVASRCGSAIQV
ncbi:hypothetical protein [Candidatus Protofrankia californiensis]|uniref:hypothetical protein n=1 Tax=Candidatus Protofrankia californiensis TaxID=1839754 RepID=UPI001041652F|nr:hypothetical protein [Candidatus Protofrankia californiensis]